MTSFVSVSHKGYYLKSCLTVPFWVTETSLGMFLWKKSEKENMLFCSFPPLFIVRYLQTFILVFLLSHHLPSLFPSTPQMFYKLWLWHLRESAASSQTSASVPMLHHPWKRALLQVRTRIEQHAVLYVKKTGRMQSRSTTDTHRSNTKIHSVPKAGAHMPTFIRLTSRQTGNAGPPTYEFCESCQRCLSLLCLRLLAEMRVLLDSSTNIHTCIQKLPSVHYQVVSACGRLLPEALEGFGSTHLQSCYTEVCAQHPCWYVTCYGMSEYLEDDSVSVQFYWKHFNKASWISTVCDLFGTVKE